MTKLQQKEKALKLLQPNSTKEEKLKGAKILLEIGGPEEKLAILNAMKNADSLEAKDALDRFLQEKGIMVDLKAFLVEDWFEAILNRIEGFEEVCDLVGYRFVAFALITGINLKSVNHNPDLPSESTVEFTIGNDSNINEMTIEEFRKALLISILSPDATETITISSPPTREEITKLLGTRYFLLAPLYNIGLKKLYIIDPSRQLDGYLIQLEHENRCEEYTIPKFRELIRKMVAQEEIREKQPLGRFSQEAIPMAEKALEMGNPARALEHLKDWVLFVRNYRISGGIAQMTKQPDPYFERGLLLVGRAYRLMKRNKISEDILRFSIQLLPHAKKIPAFFYELALIMIAEGRYGEAIAPLRKALKSGLPESLGYPLLGRALLECKRVVGAFLVLGELNKEGLLDNETRKYYEEARKLLGEAVKIIEEIPARHEVADDTTTLVYVNKPPETLS